MKTENPNFDLVTLCPPMVYGPIRHTIARADQLNESNLRIYNLFIDSSKEAPLPPNGMHVYTDVRDLAEAHILAATLPSAWNKRFVICGGKVGSQEISDMLREAITELEDRTPEGVRGGNSLDENAYECSAQLAKETLGLGFRGKKETFVDLAKQLLVIEKKAE